MENKKEVQKYKGIYMSLGICFGVSGGLLLGLLFFSDNMTLGMCYGMPLGLCVGMAIGPAKDKRLSEKMMEISRIEDIDDSTDKYIYVIDKKGEEKEYKVTNTQMKDEQFLVGDRVAEETDGSLVSLESK